MVQLQTTSYVLGPQVLVWSMIAIYKEWMFRIVDHIEKKTWRSYLILTLLKTNLSKKGEAISCLTPLFKLFSLLIKTGANREFKATFIKIITCLLRKKWSTEVKKKKCKRDILFISNLEQLSRQHSSRWNFLLDTFSIKKNIYTCKKRRSFTLYQLILQNQWTIKK